MVSADELRNVGMSALVSALVLTSADAADAQRIVSELERAAIARLHTEGSLGKSAVAAGGAVAHERDILETWSGWYTTAIGAASDIEVGGPSATTTTAIATAQQHVKDALAKELLANLGVTAGRT